MGRLSNRHGLHYFIKPLLDQRCLKALLSWGKKQTDLDCCSFLFSWEISFSFHLEVKVPQSGGRGAERWFAVSSHLLVLVHWILANPVLGQEFWSLSRFILLTSFMKKLMLCSSWTWYRPTPPKEIRKRKMRDTRTNNEDELKVKSIWVSWRPQENHRLISMPHRIDAVIHAKRDRTRYWKYILYSKYTEILFRRSMFLY